MNKSKLQAALQLFGVGWYVAFCIVAGILLGRWLDQRVFHTSFLFTLMGLGLGLVLAFLGLYRMVVAVLREPFNNDTKET